MEVRRECFWLESDAADLGWDPTGGILSGI